MYKSPKEAQVKLNKGLLDSIVLEMLKNEPNQGYEIITSLRKNFGVYFGPGDIYPMSSRKMELKGLSSRKLRRLEKKLKRDRANAEENIVIEQNRVKALKDEIERVRLRLRKPDYVERYINSERTRNEFLKLQIN